MIFQKRYIPLTWLLPECECGCGELVSKRKNRFIKGHGGHKYQKGHKFGHRFQKGHTPWRKNNPCSEESKRKMSIAKSGPNHPHWRNGISNELYCDAWADREYKNDLRKSACQRCGITDYLSFHLFGKKTLDLHHIDYNKMNCKPENLITLCCSCHTKASYNRDYWKTYYTNILLGVA